MNRRSFGKIVFGGLAALLGFKRKPAEIGSSVSYRVSFGTGNPPAQTIRMRGYSPASSISYTYYLVGKDAVITG